MTRRRTTFAVSLGLLIVLVVIAGFLRVPYVILEPGPVTNTLGAVPSELLAPGQKPGPVISVSGATTHATTGTLYLTTVSELPGDCSEHPSLWDTLKAWASSTDTVDPAAVVCPPGQSSQAVEAQDEQEMSQSQSDATTAALFALGYTPTSQHVTVSAAEAGTPAASVLEPGDILLDIDGLPVSTLAQVRAVTDSHPVGTTLSLIIERNKARKLVSVKTVAGTDHEPIIGFTPDRIATFPNVSVKFGIDPSVVGGPSAGTALALGIIDKLTAGDLTGGRVIAGTGTIDGFGNVGPIGGIQQKVAAAASHHATVFFAPSSQCSQAAAVAPSDMTVVKDTTLTQVVSSLHALDSGSTSFPNCKLAKGLG